VKPVPQPLAPVVEQPATGPTLEKEGAGYRVTAPTGGMGALQWLSPTALLTTWFPAEGKESEVYLLDMTAGRLSKAITGQVLRTVPNPIGNRALLMTARQVYLLDVAAAKVQPLETDAPGEMPDATWLDGERYVIKVGAGSRAMYGYGKLLLGDAGGIRKTLAEAGRVAAVFPDGAVLVQENWIDGPLVLHRPPFDKPPVTVAPGGPWTMGFRVGLDGNTVAWLDMEAPPGDWTQRIPSGCCGEPGPTSKDVAFYNRQTGQVVRRPVANALPRQLAWFTEGVLLEVREREFSTALFHMGTDGRLTRLAAHGYMGPITPVAGDIDGSLYYTVAGKEGQNWTELIHLYPDGRSDLLIEGIPSDWWVEDARLISYKDGVTTVTDLPTGKRRQAPGRGYPSPDMAWLAAGGMPDSPATLSILKLTTN
jgi:hypothetical protein